MRFLMNKYTQIWIAYYCTYTIGKSRNTFNLRQWYINQEYRMVISGAPLKSFIFPFFARFPHFTVYASTLSSYGKRPRNCSLLARTNLNTNNKKLVKLLYKYVNIHTLKELWRVVCPYNTSLNKFRSNYKKDSFFKKIRLYSST